MNTLKSCKNTSSAVLPSSFSPASNISLANSLMSTPAIFARRLAAFTSTGVQVGLRNTSVSERMAASSRPAVFCGMVTPFSSYIWVTMVAVQPTGWLRKYTGPLVSRLPMRW